MKPRFALPVRLLPPALAGLLGIALVAPMLTGTSPVAAQSTPATPIASGAVPATITVTGVGTVSVTPDIVHVSVGVSITDPTLSAAQEQANIVAQKLLDVARENDIADADVQTSAYSVTVIEDYDDNGNPTGTRRFQVANALTLTIRDVEAAGGILDQLVAAGANVVYGISFDVSDPGPAVAQARTDATTDARSRADAYAAGLGVEVVGIQAVTEQSAPMPVARSVGSADYEAAAAPASVPLAAGSTDVTVTVEVVFLISG